MLYRVQYFNFGSFIFGNLHEFKAMLNIYETCKNKQKQYNISRQPKEIKSYNLLYNKPNKTFGSHWCKMLNVTMHMVTQIQWIVPQLSIMIIYNSTWSSLIQ